MPPTTARDPRTVVGVLDATHHAGVDARGKVQLDGASWALDWWIGAEDRWHLPAEEASTRQRLLGASPVVETRVRVPSGDAIHRAYGARGASGAPVVVVEVENRSKVPFAVAFAVRPVGTGTVREVTAEGTEVRVDGRLAVVAAKAPGRRAARTGADGGVADVVTSGGALPEAMVSARCPDGRAEAAVVFPLAHTATLRVVLPLEPGPVDVEALPSADQVASGWGVHTRSRARVVVPDGRLQEAFDTSLAHLLLRPHGLPVAAALARLGFTDASAAALLDDPLATAMSSTPGEALLALVAHWSLTHDESFADRAVPIVASLVEALGRSGTPEELRLGSIAASGAAGLLTSVGQPKAAADIRRAGKAMADASTAAAPPAAPTGVEPLLDMLTTASPTWTWAGPDDGHELTVGAALLIGVRGVLLVEGNGPGPHLILSPDVPTSWYGQGWEVHDLPTGSGKLSYAVRWHGDRPALLWEVVPWPDSAPVRLTTPLDPTWASEEARGEALLSPVPIPEVVPTPVTTAVELGRKPGADPG